MRVSLRASDFEPLPLTTQNVDSLPVVGNLFLMSDRPVVVIGGGPAGSAAAYWLARDGHQVILAEKKEHPRDKTCGDGLTPRAIYWLEQMGFDFKVASSIA